MSEPNKRHAVAALVPCPFCDRPMTMLVDLIEDPDVVLRMADPRIVIGSGDQHQDDCDLIRRANELVGASDE